MPLFSRAPRALPRTSYGYQPPPDATAHGWACNGDDCGTSEHEMVRKWPKSCPLCGGDADPLLDEPWAHEAEGPRLEWELGRAPDGARGVYEAALIVWHYKDALQRGDAAAARDKRANGHSFVEQQLVRHPTTFIPGDVHFRIVWEGLEHQQLDDVVDELTYWQQQLKLDDVEDNNAQRTNARQLLGSELHFLKNPQGKQHIAASEIRLNAIGLAQDIRNVLTADHFADLGSLGLPIPR